MDKIRKRRPNAAKWIEAVGVVHFDLQLGQRIDYMYPRIVLSPEQESEIAFLCFPDANLIQDGDTTHHFVFGFDTSEGEAYHRHKRQQAASPSSASSGSPDNSANAGFPPGSPTSGSSGINTGQKAPLSARATELYGIARFRQRRDSSIQRGALQKSVFLLTRFPFPSLFENIINVIFSKLLDEDPAKSPQQPHGAAAAQDGNSNNNSSSSTPSSPSGSAAAATTAVADTGLPSPHIMETVKRAIHELEHTWPQPAPARMYLALSILGEALPPFESPTFDEQLDVMGSRSMVRHSQLSLRDYSAEQQLKMLLSQPPESVANSSVLSARLSTLLQQAWARKERWIQSWCINEVSNDEAAPNNGSSSSSSSREKKCGAIPVALPISTPEQFSSLNEAIWAKSLEAAEDLPPSPSIMVLPPSLPMQHLQQAGGPLSSSVERVGNNAGGGGGGGSPPSPPNSAAVSSSAAEAVFKTLDADALLNERAANHFAVPSAVAVTLRRAMEGLLDEAAAVLAEVGRSSAPLPANTRPQQIFADMRLGTCFRHHVMKLPKLFELAVLGEDVVVMGGDARVVSLAILGFRSMLGPVPFAGILRPFLTINNREVDTEASHDHDHKKPAPVGAALSSSPGGSSGSPPSSPGGGTTTGSNSLVATAHPVLIGATNPFFHRQFEKWPHLMCCGEEPESTHKMLNGDSDKRAKQQFKLKSRMFSSRHFVFKSDKSALEAISHEAPPPPLTSPIGSPLNRSVNGDSGVAAAAAKSSPKTMPLSPGTSAQLAPAAVAAASQVARSQSNDAARAMVNELYKGFFGTLERAVAAALRSVAAGPSGSLLFISDAVLQSALEPQNLLERVREEPQSTFERFKSVREALTLFAAFLQTPTFTQWLQRRLREHTREVLSTVPLEQLLKGCPDFESKLDLLHLLQWELTKQLEGPVSNVAYLERLFHLNRQALPLRDKLWSDI